MKYGFIGCGNMGGALAKALAGKTKDILLADADRARAEALAETLGCKAGTNEQVFTSCERVFLAVKPQMMADMLKTAQKTISERQDLTLITIAAGLTMEKIEQMAGKAYPVIRLMPNTPVALGQGVVMYCRNSRVSDAVIEDFLRDMACVGLMDEIPEKLIDAGCALSGCGPAYVYEFIEALADGAVACGLPRQKATRYAAMTLVGAAEMVLESGKHPGQLKDEVCSPGGSTIQGVRALEEHGFRAAAIDAVIKAYEKNVELGK